jgi:hypothetical protein
MKFVRDGSIADVDCWKPFLDATLEGCIRQDQIHLNLSTLHAK